MEIDCCIINIASMFYLNHFKTMKRKKEVKTDLIRLNSTQKLVLLNRNIYMIYFRMFDICFIIVIITLSIVLDKNNILLCQ